MKFKNEARRISDDKKPSYCRNPYGFDKVPKLLFQWSHLFQVVISQAGTYMFTGKFHDKQCGIYKCEGGCNMPGVGELVPTSNSCYFDSYDRTGKMDKKAEKVSDLITEIVLAWDPMNPIVSMLEAAAKFIGITKEEFEKGVENSRCGGVFGGNSLSSFFDWNPFSEPPYNREYRRYCHVDIMGQDAKEVDQMFADEDLGKSYKEKINAYIREKNSGTYSWAMCCSPRRNKKTGELDFWINTGRRTQIDGWKTEADIENFLKSDGVLVDTARY